MSVHIRQLTTEDLSKIQSMAEEKFTMTNTAFSIFEDSNNMSVFKYFVLPNTVYGHEKMKCFGYFDEDSKLQAVIGLRCLDNSPAWILSFIVTAYKCKNSIVIIKKLLQYAIQHQETHGFYQWYVVSKLEKFDVWQKLFFNARDNYHHYVYARVAANSMPKWLDHLQFSGGKLFPYDINISMYMSKSLCTSIDHTDLDDQLINFI